MTHSKCLDPVTAGGFAQLSCGQNKRLCMLTLGGVTLPWCVDKGYLMQSYALNLPNLEGTINSWVFDWSPRATKVAAKSCRGMVNLIGVWSNTACAPGSAVVESPYMTNQHSWSLSLAEWWLFWLQMRSHIALFWRYTISVSVYECLWSMLEGLFLT